MRNMSARISAGLLRAPWRSRPRWALRGLLVLLLGATLSLGPAALADDDDDDDDDDAYSEHRPLSSEASDHDRALSARRAGEILPLTEILDRALADFGGTFLEVELEHEDARWLYELELLSPDGAVHELVYDARSGALLAVNGTILEGAVLEGDSIEERKRKLGAIPCASCSSMTRQLLRGRLPRR